jgi:hypothetical protein
MPRLEMPYRSPLPNSMKGAHTGRMRPPQRIDKTAWPALCKTSNELRKKRGEDGLAAELK